MFFQGRTRCVDPSIVRSHISAVDPSKAGPSTSAGGSLVVANIPFCGFPAWCYPNAANPSLPHLLERRTDVDVSLGLPIPYDYVSQEVYSEIRRMHYGLCEAMVAKDGRMATLESQASSYEQKIAQQDALI
ncbi:uncharacterized protein LOC122064728 [Macadamia integrifolia]|uniref:uncharacterized protein LOC122064728 n=1 Tax=Macadamia integrifolia TaxID=60698 RepID=UPI001C5024A3|nr:uncharacterized protein LOC122064728 [Macadamia integrifolia]